jgi:hypothetical protein
MSDELDLSSVSTTSDNIDRQLIVDWWNEFDSCGSSGAATWEGLESIRLAVTDCLASDPPDIGRAKQLTAKAFFAIAGQIEC